MLRFDCTPSIRSFMETKSSHSHEAARFTGESASNNKTLLAVLAHVLVCICTAPSRAYKETELHMRQKSTQSFVIRGSSAFEGNFHWVHIATTLSRWLGPSPVARY